MLNIPNESLQDYVQHIGSLPNNFYQINVMWKRSSKSCFIFQSVGRWKKAIFLTQFAPPPFEGRQGRVECLSSLRTNRPVVLFLYSGPRSHYKRTTFEGLRPSRTAGASLRRTAVYRREEIFHFQFQTRFNFVNNIWNWNRKWKQLAADD